MGVLLRSAHDLFHYPGYLPVLLYPGTISQVAGQIFSFPDLAVLVRLATCIPLTAQLFSKWLVKSSTSPVQLSPPTRPCLPQHNHFVQVAGQIYNYPGPLPQRPCLPNHRFFLLLYIYHRSSNESVQSPIGPAISRFVYFAPDSLAPRSQQAHITSPCWNFPQPSFLITTQ